jgi:fluoride exporter
MNTWTLGLLVALGAATGGISRWWVSLVFNPVWSGFPVGTLLVNTLGGLLAGMAYVWFGKMPADVAGLTPEAWRLLCVTGFLGGLTTFSTFSVELLALLEKDRFPMAIAHVTSHVLGALVCAWLGARLMRGLF